MEVACRRRSCGRYSAFLQELAQGGLYVAEDARLPLPPEGELESLWADGLLPGTGCTSVAHGPLVVVDAGSWSRSDGPDFQGAVIELNGVRLCGDIELSHSVMDWEVAGHSLDPRFNNVVLHVVFTPPPPCWYTRNEAHREVPVLYVPQERWIEACGRCYPLSGLEAAPAPLEKLPLGRLVSLMQAAAARRVEYKRQLFRARTEQVGEAQAWYEALASTLGYSANKEAMEILARRAPLAELGNEAEAILFGTAGFLVPVLPEPSEEFSRECHRRVWDAWWHLRERFELSERRRIHWRFAGVRPMNHPHRRVAALALAACRWREIVPHLHVAGTRELTRVLSSLSHPFWDWHCRLPSIVLGRSTAVMGKARIRDFLVNHVYVQDDSAGSWQAYLSLGAAEVPQRVRALARDLLGARTDVEPLLRLYFAQQALLQLERDCRFEDGYPAALARWRA